MQTANLNSCLKRWPFFSDSYGHMKTGIQLVGSRVKSGELKPDHTFIGPWPNHADPGWHHAGCSEVVHHVIIKHGRRSKAWFYSKPVKIPFAFLFRRRGI